MEAAAFFLLFSELLLDRYVCVGMYCMRSTLLHISTSGGTGTRNPGFGLGIFSSTAMEKRV